MKAYVHTKIHTEMFITALSVESKTENNSCPSTGKWINTDIAYNGMLLSYKKEWTTDAHNMDELIPFIGLSESSQMKRVSTEWLHLLKL